MSIIPINRHRTPAIETMDRDQEAPVVVAIGGVLTAKQIALFYKPILDLGAASGLSAAQRFVPPHNRGTGRVEETRAKTNDHLQRVHEAAGQRKLLLVGHSLGGLIATAFAYENPEMVAGVVSLAGAHQGVKYKTLAMKGLNRIIGNPEATSAARYDSEFIQEHVERVETDWPEGVPLHIVTPVFDVLLPPPHGFGLRPNGRPSTNRLVVPRGYGQTPLGRYQLSRMPEDVELIRTVYPTGHMNIPHIPPVIDYVRDVRNELAGHPTLLVNLGQAV